MKLNAQWALYSKRPGDTEDYRIIANSRGPLEAAAFERQVRRFIPGTPTREAGQQDRPDALPWIWFFPSEGERGPAIGVAFMEFGRTQDYGGRRTDPTHFFHLRWAEMSAIRPTYLGLYQAVQEKKPTGHPIDPIGIDVAEPSYVELADGIASIGFEKVAAAAAFLLEESVALVNAGPLSPAERLRGLDAIVALLPYGLRAELTASTWADPGGSMRLSFATRARAGQRPIEWASRWTPDPPHGSLAERYLTVLSRLERLRSIQEIVAHLAKDTEPGSFKRASAALDRLLELDRSYATWLDVKAGRGDQAKVAALFDGDRSPDLERTAIGDLIGFLTRQVDPVVFAIVEKHWNEDQNPQLQAAIRSLLQRPGSKGFLNQHLDLADRHGQLDSLLAGMLTNAESQREPERSRLLEIVRDKFASRSGSDLPSVRAVLRNRPALVYDLLAEPAQRGDTLQVAAFVGRLANQQPLDGALRPLQMLIDRQELDERQPMARSDLEAVWQLGPRYLRMLLDLARYAGWADAVLPTVWTAISSNSSWLSHQERQEWLETLGSLPTPTVASGTAKVRRDLLMLLLGGEPVQPLRETLQSEDGGEYVTEFPFVFAEVPEKARPTLVPALARHIDRLGWTSPSSLAGRTLLVLMGTARVGPPGTRGSTQRDIEPVIRNVVIDGLMTAPDVLTLPTYQKEWRSIVEQVPDDAYRVLKGAFNSSVPRGASPVQAAVECARVLRHAGDLNIAVDCLVDFLREGHYLQHGSAIDRFHQALLAELRQGGGVQAVAENQIDSRLVGRFLEGGLGEEPAISYRRHLARAIPFEISRLTGLLEVVSDAADPEELRRLRDAAHRLETLSKRRRGFGRR